MQSEQKATNELLFKHVRKDRLDIY